MENDLRTGLYSQWVVLIHYSWLNGCNFTQVRLNNYPVQTGMLAGIETARLWPKKSDYWAFGVVFGDKGASTGLHINVCCGAKRESDMVGIVRRVEQTEHDVIYAAEPSFCRLTDTLEEQPPTAEEVAKWRKRLGI